MPKETPLSDKPKSAMTVNSMRETLFQFHDKKNTLEKRDTSAVRMTQVDHGDSFISANKGLFSRHLQFNILVNILLLICLGFQLSLLRYTAVTDYN